METCPDDLRGLWFIIKICGIKEVQETLQLHGQASEIWKIILHLLGYCSHKLSYGQTVFVCLSPTLLPVPYFSLLSIFFSFCWFNKLWSSGYGYSLSCFNFSLLSFFLHPSLFPPPLKQPLWFEFSMYLLVVCVLVKRALFKCMYFSSWASKVVPAVENLPAKAGDLRDSSSIFESGRSPVGGRGNPLQYSCLENPIDRGAWQVTVHRVAKSWTQLKWLSTHKSTFQMLLCYISLSVYYFFTHHCKFIHIIRRSLGLFILLLSSPWHIPTICCLSNLHWCISRLPPTASHYKQHRKEHLHTHPLMDLREIHLGNICYVDFNLTKLCQTAFQKNCSWQHSQQQCINPSQNIGVL